MRKFGMLGVMALLPIGLLPAAHGAECQTYAPTPAGPIRVSRPTIVWRIIPGADTHIRTVDLTINDSPTSAAYLENRRAIVCEVAKPLLPGNYTVKCHIDFDDDSGMDKEWQFSVQPDALDQLPQPSPSQEKALQQINWRRQKLGLPLLQLDGALCAAATAHSDYMRRNHDYGHEEDAQLAGFTGHEPSDRVATYGYPWVAYENVTNGTSVSEEALQNLFDAPYHRIGFLQPGTLDVGISTIGLKTTLEISATDQEGPASYPLDGQQGAPTSWTDMETPDPLRFYNVVGTVGYPITFFYFSPDFKNIKVSQATLTLDSGKTVPIYLNTPANDDALTNGALLIPQQPLRPGTHYHVSVQATTEDGHDISHSWSFTTTTENQRVAAHAAHHTLTSAAH